MTFDLMVILFYPADQKQFINENIQLGGVLLRGQLLEPPPPDFAPSLV